jgi:cell division protein FtsB
MVLAQKRSIVELKMLNAQLLTEVNDLNSGLEAIEERARNELGMIKSGEDFFQLVTRKEKSR